jgi:hypothetical protein
MRKRGRGERNWNPPASGITGNRSLIVKSDVLAEQLHRKKRVQIDNAAVFQIAQLTTSPATYEVTDMNGYLWEVAEGADSVFEVVYEPNYEDGTAKKPTQKAVLRAVKNYRRWD